MSAGAVMIPLRVAAILVPLTSSARCPACDAAKATPGMLVQALKADATKLSACVPVRIGLRFPWSVKYWMEPLAHRIGCPSTPAENPDPAMKAGPPARLTTTVQTRKIATARIRRSISSLSHLPGAADRSLQLKDADASDRGM